MRTFILCVFLAMAGFVSAQNAFTPQTNSSQTSVFYISVPASIDSTSTLVQIADYKHVPIKKLIEFLGLPMTTPYGVTPKQVDRTLEQALAAVDKIHGARLSFGGLLTALGMSVVFLALAFMAFVLGQLRRLNRERPKPTSAEPRKAIRQDDAAVAAMTALYLHVQEVREHNRMLLTWRRAPVSMWKASLLVEMPNRQYYEKRG
jgi:Na+-transporting methylmalonyl-CoA/oxaloacetate decarboxylase gamma subunit